MRAAARRVNVYMDEKKHRKMPYPEVGLPFEGQSDLMVLAQMVAGEAEGESYKGKLAVAYVAMNRVSDCRWGDNASSVVLQKWQFSCFNQGSPRIGVMMRPARNISPEVWEDCFRAASSAMFGLEKDPSKGSNHYLVSAIKDRTSWAKDQKPEVKIGAHSFYNLKW